MLGEPMRIKTVCLSLLTLVVVMVAPVVMPAEPQRPVFVADEILVQFHADVADSERQRVLAAHGLQVIRALRANGILRVRIPQGVDPRALAARLRALPEVAAAEPNYFRYSDAVPNDPRFGEMWGLHNIGQTGGTGDADVDAPEAWDISTGSPDVVVAVIDSGMDLNHADLVRNLYLNPGETLNGLDDDGNGFIDDVSGWDFRDNDNDPSDPAAACSSHGTHTAGTVGAVGNNGIGVTGVAQNVKIMPLRVLYQSLIIFCAAQDSDLIEALDYMRRMNVPISNNSWGGGPFSQLMRDAIAGTRALFVASAGNSGSNNDTAPSYPASYDLENIIAVAASNHNDQRASFSNYGVQSVDLAAPGENILSTIRGSSYGYLSGTSMAAPHVAGAAAVLLANDPTLTTHELRARILRGVDAKGLPVATGGRMNLLGSLSLPPSTVSVNVTALGPTTVSPGETVSYRVDVQNNSDATRTVTATVRAWLPSGAEVTLQGPLSVTLAADQAGSRTFSASVPATAPAGTYRLIGRVENASDAFDEDQVLYEVN
jgi:uncharacterized repeat protein (TIGR01451 family)